MGVSNVCKLRPGRKRRPLRLTQSELVAAVCGCLGLSASSDLDLQADAKLREADRLARGRPPVRRMKDGGRPVLRPTVRIALRIVRDAARLSDAERREALRLALETVTGRVVEVTTSK